MNHNASGASVRPQSINCLFRISLPQNAKSEAGTQAGGGNKKDWIFWKKNNNIAILPVSYLTCSTK